MTLKHLHDYILVQPVTTALARSAYLRTVNLLIVFAVQPICQWPRIACLIILRPIHIEKKIRNFIRKPEWPEIQRENIQNQNT